MKKIGFIKSLTSLFITATLGATFYTEASNKYANFILIENPFLSIALFLAILFGIMYISQNYFHKKVKPAKLVKYSTGKQPLVVQYLPPKGINSAEAGLLFNCRVDPIDLTSLFYQWVNDKLIYIDYCKDDSNQTKIKNITLVKLRDMPERYPYYEKELFNNIFKGDTNTKFIDKNTDLSKIVTLEGLEDLGLRKHRLYRRNSLSFGRIILSIIFVALIILCFYYLKWLGIFPLMIFAPIFCGIAFKQNNKIRLTEEGKILTSHIIGYSKFIEKCDENMLKIFLKEDPLFVDKTLPYAVAFGLETEFLKKVTPLVKDIEKSRLNSKSYPSFPVLDTISLLRMTLSSIGRISANHFLNESRHLYKMGNYGSIRGTSDKLRGSQSKMGWDYDISWGFKLGSILLKGGKLFKKGGGGGGGGGKSW